MSTQHECPYGSRRLQIEKFYTHYSADGEPSEKPSYENVWCGDGWLCDQCQEDRADARAEKIVEALGRREKAIFGPAFYKDAGEQ